jgi:MFS family permease
MTAGSLSLALPRSFWVLWSAQALSVTGGALQSIAIPLWVFSVTQSALTTGVAFALEILPIVLFSPLSGKLADQLDRKVLFVACESISAIVVLAMIYAALGDNIFLVLALAFALRAVSCLAQPTLQGLLRELLNPDTLNKGFSRFEGVGGISLMLGPILGALWFTTSGLMPALIVNAFSFALGAVLVALFVRGPRDVPELVQKIQMRDAWPWALYRIGREVLDRPFRRYLLTLECLYFGVFGGATVIGITSASADVSPAFSGIFMAVVGASMLVVTTFVLPRFDSESLRPLYIGLWLVPVAGLGFLGLAQFDIRVALLWLALVDGAANGVILARCTVAWQANLEVGDVGKAMATRRAAINGASVISSLAMPAVAIGLGPQVTVAAFAVLAGYLCLSQFKRLSTSETN